jgi:hypothetical protein
MSERNMQLNLKTLSERVEMNELNRSQNLSYYDQSFSTQHQIPKSPYEKLRSMNSVQQNGNSNNYNGIAQHQIMHRRRLQRQRRLSHDESRARGWYDDLVGKGEEKINKFKVLLKIVFQ